MLKGLGDIGALMKMQKDLKQAQKKLAQATAEGQSPDGRVKAVMNGEFKLVGIAIDEAALAPGDRKALEKSVIAAVNNAASAIKEHSAQEMKKMTGDLNIPGLDSFLK